MTTAVLEKPSFKTVTPYEFVTYDKTVRYANGTKLRFLVYGAYNVLGLIGTEWNGVAILDENKLSVICDGIGCIAPWGYNPSNATPEQLIKEFNRVSEMNYEELAAFVNNHPRRRYTL